jgi:hypothetical protein
VRLIGEAVEAGRQRCRQLAWQKEIARPRLRPLDAEKDARKLAAGAGQDLQAAGRWLETAGGRESLRRFGERSADFRPCFLRGEPDGSRLA